MTITDEILTSYLDGELTPEDCREVEAGLAAAPELMRHMLAMLRADKAAGAYFHTIDDRPLPAGVVTALEQFPTTGSDDGAADNVVPLAGAPAPTSAPAAEISPAHMPRRAAWHLPLAASIALAIGLGSGLNLGVAPQDDITSGTLIAADQPLYAVLEQGVSGQTVSLESDSGTRFATALMTVAASDGSYCREFEIAAPRVIIRGAACRQSDSNWLVAVQTAEVTADTNGDYRTASEQRPAAIAAFLAGLAPVPVDEAQEQILIANKWTE